MPTSTKSLEYIGTAYSLPLLPSDGEPSDSVTEVHPVHKALGLVPDALLLQEHEREREMG